MLTTLVFWTLDIPPCLDSELTEFPLRMRDWLKNVLVTLYERDEDNNLLTEKQKLRVSGLFPGRLPGPELAPACVRSTVPVPELGQQVQAYIPALTGALSWALTQTFPRCLWRFLCTVPPQGSEKSCNEETCCSLGLAHC